jgi:hypothetical protein
LVALGVVLAVLVVLVVLFLVWRVHFVRVNEQRECK